MKTFFEVCEELGWAESPDYDIAEAAQTYAKQVAEAVRDELAGKAYNGEAIRFDFDIDQFIK